MAQFFLYAYSKFLFFINDEQPEVFKLHRLAHQFVRADNNIDIAGFEFAQNLICLLRRASATQVIHLYGEAFEALGKGFVMLKREYGSWYKHRHLLIVRRGFHGGTNGDFGFTKPHIATHQSVHGALLFHVRLHLLGYLELVRCILVSKTCFEFLLHKTIGAESKSLLLLTLSVETNQVARNVLNLLLRALLEFLPSACAQVAQARRFALLAFVLRHLVKRVNRNENHVVVLIHQLDEFLLLTIRSRHTHQSRKLPYSVIYVYHIITGFKLHEFLKRQREFSVSCAVTLKVIFVETVEDLMIGKKGNAQRFVNKSFVKRMQNGRKGKRFPHVLKDGAQTLRLFLAIGKNVEVVTICFELSERGAEEVEILVEQGLEFYVETHNGAWRSAGFVAEFKTLATR